MWRWQGPRLQHAFGMAVACRGEADGSEERYPARASEALATFSHQIETTLGQQRLVVPCHCVGRGGAQRVAACSASARHPA